MIAFTGEYDGNTDVYVVAASGGIPKRLTYHPGPTGQSAGRTTASACSFSSPRSNFTPFPRLFTVGLEGGFPEELPLPIAEYGSFAPDGARLAYQPTPQWQPDWKRYRGGQTRRSGSPASRTPPSRGCRARTPTTNTRCGSATRSTSSRTAAARSRSLPSTRRPGRSRNSCATTVSTSSPLRFRRGRAARDRLRAVRRDPSLRPEIREVAEGGRPRRGRFPSVRAHFEKVGNRIFNAAISPTGPARSSRRAARSSPCPPRKGTRAT